LPDDIFDGHLLDIDVTDRQFVEKYLAHFDDLGRASLSFNFTVAGVPG
jgi:hypothetical protein